MVDEIDDDSRPYWMRIQDFYEPASLSPLGYECFSSIWGTGRDALAPEPALARVFTLLKLHDLGYMVREPSLRALRADLAYKATALALIDTNTHLGRWTSVMIETGREGALLTDLTVAFAEEKDRAKFMFFRHQAFLDFQPGNA